MQPNDAAQGWRESEGGAALSELLVAVAGGDKDAFARLYDRVSAVVFGVIKRVLVDPTMSEEVAQDVMLEVWRIAPRFESARGSASAWITTIAHRRAVDRVRSEQAMRDRLDRVSAMAETATDDVEAEVMRAADRSAMSEAMETLNGDQRRALELAYFGGLTQTEIAGRLGVPLGTVKSRMRQGMITLRLALEATR
ncbi:MAG: sigma-70 family RNA polymerase sigma factor [Actinomycetota bacterium]|nr:sigma-70 family RNA polymerase sigma factor [Actinomycetota bacterium]